ncbi:type I 3-dehydroquinase-domain-containing protein [Thelonectria olida]|uniref:3-dehydroquinate dehydratase n=1 Tax=Thelonectria olida TaxID=1576542 RepID=A0A9P9AR73_9HYPO|nr:type I 3-dehydroquinase-domain-containing protein [Thelonectria olida]
MACLVLVCDVEHAPLIDLASSITGYSVQTSKEIHQHSIIAYERKAFTATSLRHLRASNHKSVPVLSINLRCLSSNRHFSSADGSGDDGFEHEYLFLSGKFHRKDFCRFLSFVTGQSNPFSRIREKKRSVYIGLTYPNVRVALSNMAIVSVGADALELRVDLLQDEAKEEPFPSVDYVAEQLTLLRLHSELPIIFTIRLEPSGGKWPLNNTALATRYLEKALRWGVEFIDVEDHFGEDLRHSLLAQKRNSKIIASHHNFSGLLDWTSSSALDTYQKCASFGDVVQIAGIATDLSDTFEVQRFRSKVKDSATPSHNPPLSAFNTGKGGKLSRILNPFLQAMTHPLLPISSAPNQLSLVEANGVLTVLGETMARKIYMFGDPGSNTALMDKCFKELNLPHRAISLTYKQDSSIKSLLSEADCGGAVFEYPYSLQDQLVLDSRSTEALIGDSADTVSIEGGRLIGHSCLSIGIKALLTHEHATSALCGQDILVIGRSFSEASSVISAMLSLECGQIFTLGFSIPAEVTTRSTTCTPTEFEDALTCAGVFSTLPTKDRSLLTPLLGLIDKRHEKSKTKAMVYLDIHGSQKDPAASTARAAGWCTIMKENISAAVLAARLRVLVDQSIPYDFIRMVRRQQLY